MGAPGLRSERPQRFPGRRVFRGKRRQLGEDGEWGRGGRPAQAEAPLPAQPLHIPKQAPRPTLSGPRPDPALPFFPSEVLSSPGSARIQLPCSCSLAHVAPAPGVQFSLKGANSRQAWTFILLFGQPLHPPGIYRPPANLPPKFRSSWLSENICLKVWILEAPRSPGSPLEIPHLPSSSRFQYRPSGWAGVVAGLGGFVGGGGAPSQLFWAEIASVVWPPSLRVPMGEYGRLSSASCAIIYEKASHSPASPGVT